MWDQIMWDPSPIAFKLPFIEWPVTWYGVLFVSGILLSCFVLTHVLAATLKISRPISLKIVDRFTWYMMISILVGARLGQVFFYYPSYYLSHPVDIFKIWEGGLASHGAAIAIPIGVWLFYRSYKKDLAPLSFLQFFDLFAICVPVTCVFIRLGNFMNQEIIGYPSTLPWSITFLHPLERLPPVSRHPVQLYEALAYFIIFVVLFTCWKKKWLQKPGSLIGLLFVLSFVSRFILEFFKEAQSDYFTPWHLQMGQLLSIPFILLGMYLLFRKRSNVKFVS